MAQISGSVHGGQQPITGATIQLYATNTTSNAGASTPMLTTTVTTDSNGDFSITGDYGTCPASNPLVYLVASGGNPGLSGTVNNTDIVLMAVLGTCSSLTTSTYVVINELTTMLDVTALAPFMTDALHIGESPTNPVAIAGAMREVSSLGSLSSGGFSGNDLSLDTLQLEFYTQADILAACVNTSGGASGDGTPCGKLLQMTGAADTATAALEMAQAPTNNAAGLYGLIVAGAPFQPYFSALPSDLAVTVGYPLPFDIYSGSRELAALDSNGHVWVYYGGYTYNSAVNASTDAAGMIVVYDSNLNQLFTVASGTGGLYYPADLSADASGHVFAVNANNTISEFNSTGGAISPSGGWSTGVTASFTATGSGIGYQTNANQVGKARIDALGNIWGTVPYGNSSCYYELNSGGTAITPSNTTNFCTTLTALTDIVPDGSGNAWGFGYNAIAQVNSSGALAVTATPSQGCLYPSELGNSSTQDQETSAILYDHAHNQLWGYSQVGAGAITDSGTAVFCNNGATTMPVIVPYSNVTGVGNPYTGGYLTINQGALDGGGNLWFLTAGVAASGTETSSSGASVGFDGTATFSTYLAEVTSSGTLGTAYNVGTQTYGLQPSGVGANGSANVNGQGVYTAGLTNVGASVLGVDSSGNIWLFDDLSFRLIKVSGLATANTVNY